MRNDTEQQGLDPTRILRVVRRRAGIILLCLVLVPASALVFSLIATKQYQASAQLLFRDPQLDQKLFGSTFIAQSQDPSREAATNLQLVELNAVAVRTARKLGSTPAAVMARVKVTAEGQANLVTIAATDPQPEAAAKLANTYAQEYIGFRREADRAKINQAQRLVQRQLDELPPADAAGAQGESLRSRAEELRILASLQTGNAEQVGVAEVPGGPTTPKPMRNTTIGLFLGALLGLGLAFLFERLDRRMREPDEISERFRRPILVTIPAHKELEDLSSPLPSEVAEAFRMLRANLRYFNVDEQVRSVLVTSAEAGDGKSTISWNLAAAAAASGSRTLLIEADLRHPTLAKRSGAPGREGLSATLTHQVSLEDAVEPMTLNAGSSRARTLDVIFAGAAPPNPDELIESERMGELIARAERLYDLVIIDTPPTSVVSDAIPLVKLVSGVIVVGRLGKTSRDAAEHLRSQLDNLNARVLGVVVNYLSRRRSGYGYYAYGYRYGDDGSGSQLSPPRPRSTNGSGEHPAERRERV